MLPGTLVFFVIIVVDINHGAACNVGQWRSYEADFEYTVIVLPAQ